MIEDDSKVCVSCQPQVDLLLDKIAVLEMKLSILTPSKELLSKITNIDLEYDDISHPMVSSIMNFLEGSENISILGEYCQNSRLPLPSWNWKSKLIGSAYEHNGNLSVYFFVILRLLVLNFNAMESLINQTV
jgi:hypothetical protein